MGKLPHRYDLREHIYGIRIHKCTYALNAVEILAAVLLRLARVTDNEARDLLRERGRRRSGETCGDGENDAEELHLDACDVVRTWGGTDDAILTFGKKCGRDYVREEIRYKTASFQPAFMRFRSSSFRRQVSIEMDVTHIQFNISSVQAPQASIDAGQST